MDNATIDFNNLIKSCKLNRHKLCEAINLDYSAMSNILNGRRSLPLKYLKKIHCEMPRTISKIELALTVFSMNKPRKPVLNKMIEALKITDSLDMSLAESRIFICNLITEHKQDVLCYKLY